MSNQNRNNKKPRSGGQGHGNPNRKSNDNEQRNEQGRDRQTFYQDNQQAGARHPEYNRQPRYESNDYDSARENRGYGNSRNQSRGQWDRQREKPRAFNMKKSDKDHEGNSYPKGNDEDTARRDVKTEPDDTNAEKLFDSSDNVAEGQRPSYIYNEGQGAWQRGHPFSKRNSGKDHAPHSYPRNDSNQGNNKDAACTMVKAEPEDTNAEKLHDPSAAIKGFAVSTKSGIFKCEPNLTDQQQSLKVRRIVYLLFLLY